MEQPVANVPHRARQAHIGRIVSQILYVKSSPFSQILPKARVYRDTPPVNVLTGAIGEQPAINEEILLARLPLANHFGDAGS